MEVRTASPVWTTAALGAGLFFVTLGERAFGDMGGLRTATSGLGLVLIAASLIMRLLAWRSTKADHRRVETTFLVSHLFVILGVVGYFLSTKTGAGFFGVDPADAVAYERFRTAMLILSFILIFLGLIPMVMVEFTLGAARRTKFAPKNLADAGAVEFRRVREIAASGFTIALALALTMVTCGVAKEKNVRKDYSYFRTSEPGAGTLNKTKDRSEVIDVYLFMEKKSLAESEVTSYFDQLKRMGGNIRIHNKSRTVDAKLARELGVTKDNVIVLAVGTKRKQSIEIPKEEKRARPKLRELDNTVYEKLAKVVRDARIAYFTVGHGETNTRTPPGAPPGIGSANTIKSIMRSLNYQTRDLGSTQGLGSDVPDDATIVFILAPSVDLNQREYDSLSRYLDRGGNLVVALDPEFDVAMAPLLSKLGLAFNKETVLDDKNHAFVPRIGRLGQRAFVVTNNFGAHTSTRDMSSLNADVMLVKPGHLTKAGTLDAALKQTFVLRSESNAFVDTNANFTFEEASEKRQSYNFIAAIEPKAPAQKGEPPKRRALIIADAELASDLVLGTRYPLPRNAIERAGQVTMRNALLWVGGEENQVGEVNVESDLQVVHSKTENMVWFWANTIVVPLLIFGIGMLYVSLHKRKQRSLK